MTTMVRRVLLGALLGAVGMSCAAAVPVPAIDPRGIVGTVVLTATIDAPDVVLEAFAAAAGGRRARVAVVHAEAMSGTALASRLRSEVAEVSEVTLADPGSGTAALDVPSGLWFTGGSTAGWVRRLRDGALGERVRRVMRAGGAVGGGPEWSAAVGSGWFERDDSPRVSAGGAALAPGLIVETRPGGNRLQRALTGSPTLVGLCLPAEGAAVVRGRELRVVGAGAARVRFGATEGFPADEWEVGAARRVADLVSARRTALQRMARPFPPPMPSKPVVENGSLVIVGGGGSGREIIERFVKLAGGSEAVIAVIPISMPDPLPERDPAGEAFRRMGAREVVEIRGRTPEEVDRPEVLALLRRATGVWYGGGRQWRFVDAYDGTQAQQLIQNVLLHGGVIGGSSAGASIQGDYLARGNPLGPNEIMAEGYERGFGYLKGVAIDQHFTQRRRFADLASLIRKRPQLLGIGLDEGTAIVVSGSTAEVIGRTRICIYDAQRKPQSGPEDFISAPVGSRLNLVTREVLPP